MKKYKIYILLLVLIAVTYIVTLVSSLTSRSVSSVDQYPIDQPQNQDTATTSGISIDPSTVWQDFVLKDLGGMKGYIEAQNKNQNKTGSSSLKLSCEIRPARVSVDMGSHAGILSFRYGVCIDQDGMDIGATQYTNIRAEQGVVKADIDMSNVPQSIRDMLAYNKTIMNYKVLGRMNARQVIEQNIATLKDEMARKHCVVKQGTVGTLNSWSAEPDEVLKDMYDKAQNPLWDVCGVFGPTNGLNVVMEKEGLLLWFGAGQSLDLRIDPYSVDFVSSDL